MITRAQFLSLMEPKLRDIKSDSDFPRLPTIYTRLYDNIGTSRKKTETYFDYAGLGDFAVKTEGDLVSFTDPVSGAELPFTHVRFSNGYKITQEMIDHEQYNEMPKLEMELRLALDDFLEVEGHRLLNAAFATTGGSNGFKATDFRGEALIATSHTRIDGGTAQSNRPSTDANLDWTSLANGVIQFSLWKDERGRVIRGEPRTLIVHPNDSMTAQELMGSAQKPGTPNNEINALRGVISEVIVSPYITDTNSWYLKGASTKTVWMWDTVAGGRFGMFDDWHREVIERKAVVGFSMGHLDWRNWYGSSGTT